MGYGGGAGGRFEGLRIWNVAFLFGVVLCGNVKAHLRRQAYQSQGRMMMKKCLELIKDFELVDRGPRRSVSHLL